MKVKNGRFGRQLTASALLLGLVIVPWPVRSSLAESSPTAGPSPYLLPWEGGKRILVSQTQGGTHVGAMGNAIDFVLTRGEKVTAARSGKVTFREDRYLTCGGPELATRGNYVVLDHGDQTSALYLHLERIDVAVGQSVQQGDPVGTSGLTGWTGCSPHLHFQIQQNWGVWFSRSLPVTFNDPDVRAQDPLGALKALQSYTSGNRRPVGAPAVSQPGSQGSAAAAPSAAAVAATPSPSASASPSPSLSPTSSPVAAAPSATPLPPFPTATPAASPQAAPSNVFVGSGGSMSAGIFGQRLTVTDASSVRERPATDAPRIGMLFPGQEFEPIEVITGQAVEPPENRWVKVKVDSAQQPGFLYAGLIKGLGDGPASAATSPATPSPAPTPAAAAIGRVAYSESLAPGQWQIHVSAAVREQPTRQSSRIGGLEAGTDVTILGVVAGEMVEEGEARWARIQYLGREVYVYFGVLVTGPLDRAT